MPSADIHKISLQYEKVAETHTGMYHYKSTDGIK